MNINKDGKVVDTLYEEIKMLQDKMNKHKDTLSSFLDEKIKSYSEDKELAFVRGAISGFQIVKEFCERNIWN